MPVPVYLITTVSGAFYQVDMNPDELKVLLWRGTGIMSKRSKSKSCDLTKKYPWRQSMWDELKVTKITLPTKLGQPLLFVTSNNCGVTTAPVFGQQIIDQLDKNMDPREVTFSVTLQEDEENESVS